MRNLLLAALLLLPACGSEPEPSEPTPCAASVQLVVANQSGWERRIAIAVRATADDGRHLAEWSDPDRVMGPHSVTTPISIMSVSLGARLALTAASDLETDEPSFAEIAIPVEACVTRCRVAATSAAPPYGVSTSCESM